MDVRTRVSQGIHAGLLAGVAVALFFFVADLIRLEPLATPLALQRSFLGPGGSPIDLPVVAEVAAVGAFAVRLLAFTIVHLLTFAVLGAGAGLVLLGRKPGACALTGAFYGLVVCSLVFYGSILVTGAHLVTAVPGVLPVAGANLAAGAVMGAYLGLAPRPD